MTLEKALAYITDGDTIKIKNTQNLIKRKLNFLIFAFYSIYYYFIFGKICYEGFVSIEHSNLTWFPMLDPEDSCLACHRLPTMLSRLDLEATPVSPAPLLPSLPCNGDGVARVFSIYSMANVGIRQ